MYVSLSDVGGLSSLSPTMSGPSGPHVGPSGEGTHELRMGDSSLRTVYKVAETPLSSELCRGSRDVSTPVEEKCPLP